MILQRGIAVATVLASLGFAATMNNIGVANQSHMFVADFSRGDTPGVGYAQVVADIVTLLENNDNYIVVLEGHAGTRGPADSNLVLSERRAERMSKDLQSQGVDNNRIVVAHKGETEPLVQNEFENDGAYQSRLGRVEIYIIHENIDLESVL